MRRRPALCLTAVFCIAAFSLLTSSRSQPATADTGVQSIFIGDRQCGDDPLGWCSLSVSPAHRYLHIVLHDAAGNDDWRVQIANECSPTMSDTVEGQPIPSKGFLETVFDMNSLGTSPPDTSLCFIFRGRNHYWATYYAAYLDDVGTTDAASVYPNFESLGGRPALPDLSVAYIHTTPSLPYDASPNKPTQGQNVQFSALVLNAGGEPAPPFTYVWSVDHKTVNQGTFSGDLIPGADTKVVLSWPWDWRPHDLRLQLLPAGVETSSTNDALTVRTNALHLGFWVEKSAYDYFQANQWFYCQSEPCAGSDSFYDWLQRQVSTWNALFAASTYPGAAPAGIADRVSVDDVTIVPDGTLPLHGGLATNAPDAMDRSVDLQWGLPAANVAKAYRLHTDQSFDVDWGLLHELGHARSLADLYRFDIPMSGTFSFDFTALDGRTVFDPAHPFDPANKLQPFVAGQNQTFLYQNREQDLMSCTCTPVYSAYTAVVLNRIRGHRAMCGNSNPPCNLGDWFREIPPVNRIRILNRSGTPLSEGSKIRVFFDQGPGYTAHEFDSSHSQTLTVHGGAIQLGSDPFRSGTDRWAAGHNLLLLDVQDSGGEELCFVEPTELNMVYWSGYRTVSQPATFTLRLGQQTHNSCNLTPPPVLINEPYATSPSNSVVHFGRPRTTQESHYRVITVDLMDDATPAHAMHGRMVHVLDSNNHMLGTGITSTSGEVRFLVGARVNAVQILDVTDNNLSFPATAGSRPRRGVRPL